MALNPSQYNDIMRQYDQRRIHNKEKLLDRFSSIYQEIPKIKEIDGCIAGNSIRKGKALLNNNSKELLNELSLSNSELSMKKVELLVEHGYPKNYLESIYDCTKCKDTGYIGSEKCSCFKQSIVDMLYSQSNIKDRLAKENFNSFSFDYYSDVPDSADRPSPKEFMHSLVLQIKEFIHNFNSTPANFLFQGNTGVGKTFLSNCIAKELMDQGHTIVYLTAFQMFDIFEKHTFFKTKKNDYSGELNFILESSLLIIDDLGTELNNSFTTSQLFLCINERLLRDKSTIISTNLSLSDLTAAYTERVVSRLVENYRICNIYGQDIRMIKALHDC